VRLRLVALVALAGCVPGDDPTITADIAVETACALASQADESPDDAAPKPGDPCPNCDGRGYVGDGTVRVTCQACGGGKVVRSVLVRECPDGKCRPKGL
jgi:hypothetical protein